MHLCALCLTLLILPVHRHLSSQMSGLWQGQEYRKEKASASPGTPTKTESARATPFMPIALLTDTGAACIVALMVRASASYARADAGSTQ